MVIPDWALGVGFIVSIVAAAQVVIVKLRASTRVLPPPGSDPEVGELRQTVDALQSKVGELEERLDFTERLLANQRDPGRLQPPAS